MVALVDIGTGKQMRTIRMLAATAGLAAEAAVDVVLNLS